MKVRKIIEESTNDLMDNFKCLRHVKLKSQKGVGGKIFEEIMAECFPNWIKCKNPQVQEAQQIPTSTNLKKTTLKYIIIKLLKASD